ncbi:hypothetical protein [Alterisphingorhabdus coralli]|uniref:Uncharacterized protein n=1 Tax=Alterisphingorhabdus coralli TaxID=3071408 RepID=A0AA97HZL3_9SPHN|nr:hypothetical protein [Parasphingorhabdus sp. SCSIO 66989]WOE74839.1 hypothetical protein RB602_13500 [Parasphingorhabdus sp. SCSIO 66989]
MVDTFSILLTHALIALAGWRIIHRDDLDREDPPEQDAEPAGFNLRRNRQHRDQGS